MIFTELSIAETVDLINLHEIILKYCFRVVLYGEIVEIDGGFYEGVERFLLDRIHRVQG